MWLTGGIQPDHSVIGKFLKNHQEELSQSFFEQLTRKIIQEIKIDGTRISGDGTVIQAVASRYKTLMEESLTDKLNSLEDKIKQETDSKKLERLLKKKKK